MTKNLFLYTFTVLIWGSTWLAIKFQLGEVAPTVSVAYRFSLAAVILLIYSKIRGLNLRFGLKDHINMALLGTFLFSLNYWLVYISEIHLTSGLVAVIFSSIVLFNTFNGYLILRSPITIGMIIGALIGLLGIALVFHNEILAFDFSNNGLYGLSLGLGAAFIASLGNITAEYSQRRGLPVIQTNAFGMTYGAVIMLLVSFLSGQTFAFPVSPSYIGSLFYLSVLGSIVAFGLYLTLLGRIGSAKAAYSIMLTPIVALIFSTIFEGYVWSAAAFAGLGLVLIGNVILLQSKFKTQKSPAAKPGFQPLPAGSKN